jgi:hypothetical protein
MKRRMCCFDAIDYSYAYSIENLDPRPLHSREAPVACAFPFCPRLPASRGGGVGPAVS